MARALAFEKLVGKLRNELLGILVRTVHVVAARNDAGQIERSVVGLDDELGTGLGSGVRVRRFQDMLFSHGLGIKVLALAVDLIGGHMDEAADGVAIFGRLQQHVRAHDVVMRELERVAEGVVHVRLRREVHDRVDLLRLQDVVDEVRRADVALDELVVRQRRDLLEVREARAVVEAVEVQDLVLRVPARRRRLAQLLSTGLRRRRGDIAARRVEFHAARLYFLQSRMTTCDALNPAPPVIRMCRSNPLP